MSKKKAPAKTASKGSAAKAKTLLTGVVKELKDLGAKKKKPASGEAPKSAKSGAKAHSVKKSQTSSEKQLGNSAKKPVAKVVSGSKKQESSSKAAKPAAKAKTSGTKSNSRPASVTKETKTKAKAQGELKLGILQKSPASGSSSKKSTSNRSNESSPSTGVEATGRKSASSNAAEGVAPKKSESSASSGGSDYAKWQSYYKKYGNLPARDYDMSQKYEARTPIMHRSLGWGFILSIENDRLQVLFAEGIKLLISNYNPQLKL